VQPRFAIKRRLGKALSQGSLPVVLGSFANAAVAGAFAVFLTRTQGVNAFAAFALAQSLASPISVLALGRMNALATTDAELEDRFSAYLAARLGIDFCAVALIVCIGLVQQQGPTYWAWCLSVGFWKAADNLGLLVYAGHQRLQKAARMGYSLMLRAALSSLAALLLLTPLPGYATVLAIVAAQVLIFTFFDLPRLQPLNPLQRTQASLGPVLGNILRNGVPLGASSAYALFAWMFHRILLSGDSQALAEIASITSISAIVGLLTSALIQANFGTLVAAVETGDPAQIKPAVREVRGITLKMSLASAGLLIVGEGWLVPFLFGEIAPRPLLMPMVGLAAGAQVALLGYSNVLSARKMFGLQVRAAVASSTVVILVTAGLVHLIGVYGVPGAMLCGVLVNGAILFFGAREKEEDKVVVHILGSVNQGGAEQRLLEALKASGSDRLEHLVVVHANPPGTLADSFRATGARIVSISLNAGYVLRLWCQLRRERPICVISYVSSFSGVPLFVAWLAGVRRRIVFYRTNRVFKPSRFDALKQACFRALTRLSATEIVGVAQGVLRTHWPRLEAQGGGLIIYSGVNPAPLRADARPEEGGSEPWIVVCVGRISRAKNQPWAVEVCGQASFRTGRSIVLRLAGRCVDISLEELREQAAAYPGLTLDYVGEVSPIGAAFRGASALIHPSLHEGLPGVVLEAWACGLPILASAGINVEEVAAHSSSIRILPLIEPVEVWADALAGLCEDRARPGRLREIEAEFDASPFTHHRSLEGLEDLWEGRRR